MANKMASDKSRIVFAAKTKVKERLQQIADENGITLTDVIGIALQNFLSDDGEKPRGDLDGDQPRDDE
jgi:antitoxin component of RelBE/YafQ-DinJ toxin-antitoxin module